MTNTVAFRISTKSFCYLCFVCSQTVYMLFQFSRSTNCVFLALAFESTVAPVLPGPDSHDTRRGVAPVTIAADGSRSARTDNVRRRRRLKLSKSTLINTFQQGRSRTAHVRLCVLVRAAYNLLELDCKVLSVCCCYLCRNK